MSLVTILNVLIVVINITNKMNLERTEEYLEKEPKERELYVLNKQKKILKKNIKEYEEIIPLLKKQLDEINKKIKEVIRKYIQEQTNAKNKHNSIKTK